MRAFDDRLLPGSAHVPGATPDGAGTNFALFSAHAEKVDLCLFDEGGQREVARMAMPERTDGVWHGYLAGAAPGLAYGYRVDGPFEPKHGHRFDSRQILLDPYARRWLGRLSLRGRPRCVVSAADTGAGAARIEGRRLGDSVIYEAHVKGLSRRHPDVAANLRGTYAGLATPPIIDHLVGLGITAIELLPIQAFADEPRLLRQGLTNYWGYNPVGFFVPEPRYCATGDGLAELREAVAALHEAGIEVLLDVVYNHTGEGDHTGPTLAFRGIDNASYYRLDEKNPAIYVNDTGCGNTLNIEHPRVLQLVMDSLRYWVETVGIDGFRFDLALTLGREGGNFNRDACFFKALAQDPALSRVKLIAEPWDLGFGGYQLGRFGAGWGEWNDRFRDTVRGFWRGDEGLLPEMAARLLGSADRFDHDGKPAQSSINFVTAHDGFTLADLVSYEDRHNEANGEANDDGHGHNLSWNNGIEGPSDDPAVQRKRLQDSVNLLATVLLAQGTPMLSMGDELCRSQQGNNNAYCQDNETSWIDWQLARRPGPLANAVRLLIRLRLDHPVFRRRRFLHGSEASNGRDKDVTWLHPDGQEMTAEDWHHAGGRIILLMLDGAVSGELGDDGAPALDGCFLLILNGGTEPVECRLPEGDWQIVLDSAALEVAGYVRTGTCRAAPSSFTVLERCA